MVPAFGDTIRCFEGNVSDMKRLAGHDLEDMLQVYGPFDAKILYYSQNLSVSFPALKACSLNHIILL